MKHLLIALALATTVSTASAGDRYVTKDDRLGFRYLGDLKAVIALNDHDPTAAAQALDALKAQGQARSLPKDLKVEVMNTAEETFGRYKPRTIYFCQRPWDENGCWWAYKSW